MSFLRTCWPLSFRKKNSVTDLVISVVIYFVVAVVAGVLIGILWNVPVVGIIIRPISSLLDAYCTAGIVFTFLNYFNVGAFRD